MSRDGNPRTTTLFVTTTKREHPNLVMQLRGLLCKQCAPAAADRFHAITGRSKLPFRNNSPSFRSLSVMHSPLHEAHNGFLFNKCTDNLFMMCLITLSRLPPVIGNLGNYRERIIHSLAASELIIAPASATLTISSQIRSVRCPVQHADNSPNET